MNINMNLLIVWLVGLILFPFLMRYLINLSIMTKKLFAGVVACLFGLLKLLLYLSIDIKPAMTLFTGVFQFNLTAIITFPIIYIMFDPMKNFAGNQKKRKREKVKKKQNL